ncbi:MAG: SusC/RagA family TonB-linked outer membrane protein [Bacteroidales bacterium]|jgi:TonB-linked SusC/RagA family outer membrane protein|nr:SusC/RagA family TonB-linked outer membrane protein [Bacteroidales bacterium]
MKKLTILFLFFLFTMQVAFAQRAVTGKVVTVDGVPLPGVTVMVQGTTTGTTTDVNGGFSVQVPDNQAVLRVSFVGFVPQEVAVGTQSAVNVTLSETAEQLSEVVITALGIKKEAKSLGYAVSTVGADVLTENRSTNAMQALEGRVSGLNISSMSAGAGGSTQIRLRGQSAFSGANNAPLIVVNGLPMDQDARASGTSRGANRDTGDALNNINPDDIETMTVLKGATAAALYGSRAANGAILITTKSGAGAGQIGIEFSSNFTTQSVLDYFDFQTMYGHGAMGQKPTTADASTANAAMVWGGLLDGSMIEIYDGSKVPYSFVPNRIKDYFRTGQVLTNTVAVSGGTDKGSFRASFSNTDTKGIEPTNSYKRNTANTSIVHEIVPKLNFTFNMNYTNEQYINPPQGGMQGPGVMNFLTRITPVIPLDVFKNSAYAEDGTEAKTSAFNSSVFNPYYAQQAGQLYFNERDRFLGTASLRYDIADWLYVMGRYNYDYSYFFNEQKTPGGIGAGQGPLHQDGTYRGEYRLRNDKGTEVNADFLLGFSKQLNDFSIDASFGGNTYRVKSNGLELEATNFIARDFFSIPNGTIRTPTVRHRETRVNSLYGVAGFGYKSTYYINVTGRNDWFSVLDPANNDEFYPSVSGSIVFSELLKTNWLNYGKLRGSWTEVGNAAGVNAYEGNLTYTIANNPFNGQTTGSISGNQSPNPNLTPFTVKEKEIGLEMRMFNNRLYVDVAAFDKVSSGQIMSVNLSLASGYENIKQNIGSLKNSGIEWVIEYQPVITQDFSWATSWNHGYLTNEVLSVGNDLEGNPIKELTVNSPGGDTFVAQMRYVVGKSLNQIYAKDYARNDKGEIIVNANGRLVNNTSNPYVSFGGAMPKHTGGWNNTFNYKNLTLSVFLDYKFGGKVYSSTNLNLTRQGFSKMSLEGRNIIGVDGSGKNIYEEGMTFPAVYAPGTKDANGVDISGQPNTSVVKDLQSFYADYRNYNIGEPFIYKTDFVKLRSISLSYNLTNQVSKVEFLKFVKGLTLTASCRNVAILYKDIPNLDPEAMQSGNDQFAGYEGLSLPTTRNFTFGLNVKF